MPDQVTEKHPEEEEEEEADTTTTRDRHHPPQTQDNSSPLVPTRDARLPLILEQPLENAERTPAIHASTGPTHATRKRAAAPLSAAAEEESGYEADS
ncbi:hypothetical protein GP486_007704, partial [Trichoglossum hirsutum]